MKHACELDIATLKAPTTLDEALVCFEQMKDALLEMEARVKQAESDVENAREEADGAEGWAEEDGDALDDCIRALACVFQKLKAKRTAEAISDFDHAFQRYDCGGKIRMAAVML